MRPISLNIAATAAIAGLVACAGARGQDIDGAGLAAARAEFMAAFGAERLGLSIPNDSARLSEYPLYRYLRAARLERRLSDRTVDHAATDERVTEFLAEFGDEPVGIALRRAWLDSLATRERWNALLENFDARAATQTLACQRMTARIALGRTDDLAPDIVAAWLTARQLPPACEGPFQWLRDQSLLGDALVEQRARLLLDAGQGAFASVIARRLPPEAAEPINLWADLIRNPAATLDTLMLGPGRTVERAALLDGFARLARDDPSAALERVDAVIGLVGDDPDAARDVSLSLALGLAWDRNVRALEFFTRASTAGDDYALTWLARTALWAREWALVDRSIAAMSEAQRAEPAWRYWAARAAEARDDDARARALYESILPDDNYYSVMAAARLGVRFEPHAETFASDAAILADLAAWPVFVRARELTLAGLRSRATLEWRHADAVLSRDERAQSIHLAARWELYDIAVATATALEIFADYDLLYPRPYRDAVRGAARTTGIDLPLLYGLLRQESLFRPDAVSGADAIGVAQLQPSTAALAARSRNLPAPSRADLFDPGTSISLGAARLAALLEEFDGQLAVALAAYNAGNGRALRWLPENPLDTDIWIENIPFNETRAYVRRVLWHSVVYEWLDRGRPVATGAWIDVVRPLTDD